MSTSGRRQPWFSFIVHPRSVEDLDNCGGTKFLRRYSADENEYLRKVSMLPPLVVGEVVFGASPLRGEVVAVMRMPSDMTGADAARTVADGVAVAARRGARVVGLGGLTAPATGAGERLLRRLPAGITLTNGNALTAAVILCNVNEAGARLGLGRQHATIGVVGCTGSVGTAFTHLLAEAGYRMILVGRNLQRLAHKFADIPHATHATDLAALKAADIVVLLTNDATAALRPDHVERGCVVIDAAQPSNVPDEARSNFTASGVAVCTGGVVHIPSLICTCNFGFCSGETFACLAETYLFARHGLRQHSTGAPLADQAKRLWRLAEREGIKVRSLSEMACCSACAPPTPTWQAV